MSAIRAGRSDVIRDRRWQGLLLNVTSAPRYPGLLVQVAAGRRIMIRQGSTAILLARVDAARCYVDYLRLRGYQSALPPLRAAQSRQFAEQPAVDRDMRWAYQFADLLTSTENGPLYPSRWLLHTAAPYLRYVHTPASATDRWSQLILDQDAAELDWFVHNGGGLVLALRSMSSPEHGRVKAYRKQVRDGTLPPVLLWWVSSLDSYLLLDGHDRLAACLAENAEPPLMTLTAVLDAEHVDRSHSLSTKRHLETVAHIEAEISQGTSGAKEALVSEQRRFADALIAQQVGAKLTRARSLPGGVSEWTRIASLGDRQWAEDHR